MPASTRAESPLPDVFVDELIQAEAAEVIGAARYGRSDTRVNERNGVR
jgi:transposase-like protein